MNQDPRFTLSSIAGRTVPNDGEELGRLLASYAADQERALQPRRAADLYYLAADAFDAACGVTMGHGRADRYSTEARRLRALAHDLMVKP